MSYVHAHSHRSNLLLSRGIRVAPSPLPHPTHTHSLTHYIHIHSHRIRTFDCLAAFVSAPSPHTHSRTLCTPSPRVFTLPCPFIPHTQSFPLQHHSLHFQDSLSNIIHSTLSHSLSYSFHSTFRHPTTVLHVQALPLQHHARHTQSFPL